MEQWLTDQKREVKELQERAQVGLLKAVIKIDDAWRSRKMAPCCPHCHAVILPKDGFGDVRVNKEMELARRLKQDTA
jgi:hypothetical protein